MKKLWPYGEYKVLYRSFGSKFPWGGWFFPLGGLDIYQAQCKPLLQHYETEVEIGVILPSVFLFQICIYIFCQFIFQTRKQMQFFLIIYFFGGEMHLKH